MSELDEYEKDMTEECDCRMQCFGALFLFAAIVFTAGILWWTFG